ncbi:MAG: hypothetical protein ACJ72N_07550 [Labedaea sp.]|jgi:hypothetical protein
MYKQNPQQLAFQLAEQGAALAESRANRMHGDWSSKALAAWHDYARRNARFTAEDVRLAYSEIVPPAPDNRAWGVIPRMAIRKGYVQRIGMTHAKSAHCHGTWISEYESLICGG